jgi:WS/DGAT/MGAT family acyltransferase
MTQPHPDERLSAADTSNVDLDAADQVNAFLLAGILGVGGFVHADGSCDLDRLRSDLGARLRDPQRALRRLSQRVAERDRGLVWEACEPDLSWHVRLADAIPGRDGLAGLCATLMTRPVPSDRPGWELLVVPGTPVDGVGIVFRAHHAIADGVAGVRLAEALFGSGAPGPAPTRATTIPATRRSWWSTVTTGVVRMSAMFRRSVPPTVLLGPIGGRRGVGFTEIELAPLAEAARRSGGTLNDALLAAVAAAAAAVLRASGEPVPAVLPASVPVALPERGGSGNAVGVMVAELPTDELDPVVRLGRITAVTRAAKAEARQSGTFEFTRSRWGSRLFAWLARRQRFVALFVTNVRGPSETLSIGGAPLEHAWPLAPIQGNVRLGVAALSYRGRLACTVHTDASALDARELSRLVSEELADLAARVA